MSNPEDGINPLASRQKAATEVTFQVICWTTALMGFVTFEVSVNLLDLTIDESIELLGVISIAVIAGFSIAGFVSGQISGLACWIAGDSPVVTHRLAVGLGLIFCFAIFGWLIVLSQSKRLQSASMIVPWS